MSRTSGTISNVTSARPVPARSRCRRPWRQPPTRGSRSTQVDFRPQPALAGPVDRAPGNDNVLDRIADGFEERDPVRTGPPWRGAAGDRTQLASKMLA